MSIQNKIEFKTLKNLIWVNSNRELNQDQPESGPKLDWIKSLVHESAQNQDVRTGLAPPFLIVIRTSPFDKKTKNKTNIAVISENSKNWSQK